MRQGKKLCDRDVKRVVHQMNWKSSSQVSSPLASFLQCILSHSLRGVFAEDRQRGRLLRLRLSISSSRGFYKKMTASKIDFDEDLMD